MPPFALGSMRLWRPSTAPEIRWADGFSVADGILGWSCQRCGGKGGHAHRGPSPSHPGASLLTFRAGSSHVAWEDAGGHVPNMQTPTALPYKCVRLWHLAICLQSHFGGNLAYFYCHLIYRTVPARRAAAPSLPHPGGAARSCCWHGEEHRESIRSASRPAKHLCLRGSILGFSIHHLVMKSPFIYPNETAYFLTAR